MNQQQDTPPFSHLIEHNFRLYLCYDEMEAEKWKREFKDGRLERREEIQIASTREKAVKAAHEHRTTEQALKQTRYRLEHTYGKDAELGLDLRR